MGTLVGSGLRAQVSKEAAASLHPPRVAQAACQSPSAPSAPRGCDGQSLSWSEEGKVNLRTFKAESGGSVPVAEPQPRCQADGPVRLLLPGPGTVPTDSPGSALCPGTYA